MPDSTALAYAGPDGGIAGYGVIRKCLEGHKIGPLFADSPEIADKILEGPTFSVRGETIYFDTPEINQDAIKMVKQRDMSEVFGTVRMYTGDIPNLPVERIFGVTTFELG